MPQWVIDLGGVPSLVLVAAFFVYFRWQTLDRLDNIERSLFSIAERDRSVDERSMNWRDEQKELSATLKSLVDEQRRSNDALARSNENLVSVLQQMSRDNTAEHTKMITLLEHMETRMK